MQFMSWKPNLKKPLQNYSSTDILFLLVNEKEIAMIVEILALGLLTAIAVLLVVGGWDSWNDKI